MLSNSALKESGYESDSTLIFRRREDASPLSPIEQRIAYKTVQKGGDVPLHGLRKPAPERPKGKFFLSSLLYKVYCKTREQFIKSTFEYNRLFVGII